MSTISCTYSHISHLNIDSGKDYIDKVKFQGITWDNKVMIFTTAQSTGKDVVTYINGWFESHFTSGTFKKHTKNSLHLCNTENIHLNPSLHFKFHYLNILYIFCIRCLFISSHIYLNFYQMCQCTLFILFFVFNFMFHYHFVI